MTAIHEAVPYDSNFPSRFAWSNNALRLASAAIAGILANSSPKNSSFASVAKPKTRSSALAADIVDHALSYLEAGVIPFATLKSRKTLPTCSLSCSVREIALVIDQNLHNVIDWVNIFNSWPGNEVKN